jgi:hypothetical protein
MAEITYLAQVLHWPLTDLLDLEHPDRRQIIDLIAQAEPVASGSAEAW